MGSKLSAAALITTASNLASFISFILWCIFCSWIMSLQDFYSGFRSIFNLLSYLLLDSWKSSCHLPGKNSVARDDVSASKPRHMVEVTREDAELVMEKLGLLEEHQPLLQDSFEIEKVFDTKELSLDEVREAFRLFDGNDDGYIDAEDLQRVMSSLGFVGLCENECRRMIMAFDVDGDGRIDFGEFVTLIEENVCC